jgi:glutamate-1-semialdehyde 2,1-aminomutase/spore coat polysaccharide biosynthesis protein SpsF
MVTAIIIQARMGSSRLPGKMLRLLGGRSILAEVIRRCRAIPSADAVCLASPEGATDDVLAVEAERAGATVFRGDANDVLSRFAGAAEALGAHVVMRITGDKPLIDPEICGRLLRLRAEADADFACNNMPAGWPHGLDCEAFTSEALARADCEAETAEDREHVTPWLRRHAGLRRVNLQGPGGDCVDLRWTLDYPEDLAFLKALFEKLPPAPAMPLFNDVMAVLDRHPEITAINACWQHLSRYAASSSETLPGSGG